MKFRGSLFVFAFLSVPRFVFGAEPGIPPGTDLSRIYNRPRVVSSSISWETLENRRWILMDADVHVFSDIPFEKLCALSRDMENFPSFFRRLKGAGVTKFGSSSLIEMSVSVGLMGINYETTYTMYVTEPVNISGRLLIDYSFFSGDGLVKNDAHGTWYLDAASQDGVPGTYVRYTAHGVVLKKYPLQETIMEMFINMEHVEIMNQLLREGRKR
ncbi:MAG: hypothetical protein LBP27_04395 [Treponema sp.]|jgi:hypothetical protein|nr:hypothetical protein [Treponema sp.]